MTLKEEMKEILGIKKMQEISKESLHPPMAPPKVVSSVVKPAELAGVKTKGTDLGTDTITLGKPIVSETEVCEGSSPEGIARSVGAPHEISSSKLAIDFSYLANNSSFQRGIMEFIKKYVPGLENVDARGSKEVMKQSFDQNAHNYREVMAELKLKLQEKRVE